MKPIKIIFSTVISIVVIILGIEIMQYVVELNSVVNTIPIWLPFLVMILFSMLGISIIISSTFKQHRAVIIENKKNYLLWLDKRITEMQEEYDKAETTSYKTGLDYEQILLTKGGKLKAYKEIYDYIKTH